MFVALATIVHDRRSMSNASGSSKGRAAYLLPASLLVCGVGVAALIVIGLLDKAHQFNPKRFSAHTFLLASPFAGVAAAAVWWRAHRWLPVAALLVAAACMGLILWGTLTDHIEWSRTKTGNEVMYIGGFLAMLSAWMMCLGLMLAGMASWGVRRWRACKSRPNSVS